IMTEIASGRAVNADRSAQMMQLLERQPLESKTGGQSRDYTGMALPQGSKLWSKAGWTSEARHDAAYVELPTGERFVLVTFTMGHASDKEIIATVARSIIAEFTAAK